MWKQFDASQLASARGYRADKALVWGWYEWRRMMVLNAQPDQAHITIAEMANLFEYFTLTSQNIDDLHERWQ